MQEDLLSIEQVNFVGTNIEQLFKIELGRLTVRNPDHAKRVSEFVLTLFMERLSTFFTLSVIKDRAETINTNPAIRDFVLDLSEKFSFALTNSELEGGKKLLFTIVESIKRNHQKRSNLTLLNPSTADTLTFDEEVLRELLENNFWLLTLYLLVLYFSPSSIEPSSKKEASVRSNR